MSPQRKLGVYTYMWMQWMTHDIDIHCGKVSSEIHKDQSQGNCSRQSFFCHYRKDLSDKQPVYAISKHHHLDAGLCLPVSHNSLLQSFKSGNIRLCMCILLGFLAYHALIQATQDLLILLVDICTSFTAVKLAVLYKILVDTSSMACQLRMKCELKLPHKEL